ncbi:MAG: transketolase [Candidatus Micrarchaeia archaeon]|jgi:transketolase
MREKTRDLKKLAGLAREVRKNVLKMTSAASSGHPGGSLSATDILVALYFSKMRVDSKNPCLEKRDRLVLSKGHGAPALYATLAEAGFFPKEELSTLRRMHSRLQGHPERCTPGIDVATGSLGQGLSVANGIAMALRLDNSESRVYAILGDGECDEGQVWEAASTAAHFKVDNVCAIVDANKLQLDGRTDDVKHKRSLAQKFESFGWHVVRIDGHDFAQILAALDSAEKIKGKPTAIIADTVKGKGVSFMENVVGYHGKPLSPEELQKALAELDANAEVD